MIARERHVQLGCLPNGCPGLDRHRQQIEARFVYEEQSSSFVFGFFFSAGQRCCCHCAIAASFR